MMAGDAQRTSHSVLNALTGADTIYMSERVRIQHTRTIEGGKVTDERLTWTGDMDADEARATMDRMEKNMLGAMGRLDARFDALFNSVFGKGRDD